MEVLSQYEAVSFGDHLFANYTLLPLQQRFGPRYKLALWMEKTEILHALNLPITKVRHLYHPFPLLLVGQKNKHWREAVGGWGVGSGKSCYTVV